MSGVEACMENTEHRSRGLTRHAALGAPGCRFTRGVSCVCVPAGCQRKGADSVGQQTVIKSATVCLGVVKWVLYLNSYFTASLVEFKRDTV